MNNKPKLLIDDNCALCNRTVLFIVQNGGKNEFSFLSLYSDEGKVVLTEYGFPANYTESVVLINDGKAYIKSDAVLRVFKKLNGIYPWLYWFIIVPKIIRDGIYNIISKHRHRIYNSH